MTPDREQTQRDAERWLEPFDNASGGQSEELRLAGQRILALLAELEQAERERDEEREMIRGYEISEHDLEARLAKVPALVEALRWFALDKRIGYKAQSALTTWEQE